MIGRGNLYHNEGIYFFTSFVSLNMFNVSYTYDLTVQIEAIPADIIMFNISRSGRYTIFNSTQIHNFTIFKIDI